MDKKKIIISFVIILGIVLLAAYIWFLVAAYKKVYPKPGTETIEVLQSPDAEPIEITPEMLELITPPPDAEPIEITPEMLELITPPKAE